MYLHIRIIDFSQSVKNSKSHRLSISQSIFVKNCTTKFLIHGDRTFVLRLHGKIAVLFGKVKIKNHLMSEKKLLDGVLSLRLE